MPQTPCRHNHQRYFSTINLLLAIPVVVLFAPSANAIPAPTAAAADILDAAPTPTIPMTYTVTKISSMTLTTTSPVLHISPHILELITTMTVTTYEPWPGFASLGLGVGLGEGSGKGLEKGVEKGLGKGAEKGLGKWSSTVLEEVVCSVTWVERRRYLDMGTGSEGIRKGEAELKQDETTITSFVVTTENTWVVHPAGQTGVFLPAEKEVGCGGCSLAQSDGPESTSTEQAASVLEDPTCLSTNLTTGCQGQCIWKPSLHPNDASSSSTDKSTDTAASQGQGQGTFWCLHIHPYQYSSDPSLRMGRACWGYFLRYRQLNKPCLVGDVGMACLPCVNGVDGAVGGRDQTWDAVFWEGEE